MSAKKVVLVIVEGPSDEDALGLIFENYYNKETVRVKVIHGDITTEKQISISNILNRISEIVQQSIKEYKLRKTDLLRVIHLVDTDGAFAPDLAIAFDEMAEHPFYTLTEIKTNSPERIKQRNQQKKANLIKLHMTKLIWKSIPYSAYYLSCNLDHVLYNKLNLTDEEKEQHALSFAQKYRNDIPAFIKFICSSDFSIIDDYLSSWSFIKQDLHSLERYTNIGLIFKTILPE